jgi:coenzyme F420-reducing hydrogenase alpha subunit
MPFQNSTKLGANDVYKQMLEERKIVIQEVTSLKNLIHSEVETIVKDFKSTISVDGIEEKLRDAEKNDLTQKDKEIIKYIQKVLDSFVELDKVEYEGVISTKEANIAAGGDKKEDEAPADDKALEDEMKSKDENFDAPADEEFNFSDEEEPVA